MTDVGRTIRAGLHPHLVPYDLASVHAVRFFSQAFLCGYANFCTLHGSREALETAKSNVERFFQLVGIMEMSHESIQMFERVAPEFLTGISNKTRKLIS